MFFNQRTDPVQLRWRIKSSVTGIIVVAWLSLTSCHPEVAIEPTLVSIQQQVFNQHCLSCHSAQQQNYHLDLSAGKAIGNLLYVTSFMEPPLNLIEAGDPANSLLVRKLEGTALTNRMPLAPLPQVPQSKRDAVRTWIQNMRPIPQPTITYLQKNFYDVSCAVGGCHEGASSAAGLDLSAGNTVANVFGVPSVQIPAMDLVEPGDPANSYLLKKLEGTGLGQRMPLSGGSIQAATIEAVRDWIAGLRQPQPNIEWIQENIYDVSCTHAGCHDGSAMSAGGLDLRRNFAQANTVLVPSRQLPSLSLISPGNADASYLVKKIEAANGIIEARMPLGKPMLTQEKINVLRQYIDLLGPPPAALEPVLAAIQSQVFDVSCAVGGCHDRVSSIANLDLSAGNAYNSLVNVSSTQVPSLNLVEPGRPEVSYFVHKILGNADFGSPMPPAKAPLRPDIIDAIRQWISAL